MQVKNIINEENAKNIVSEKYTKDFEKFQKDLNDEALTNEVAKEAFIDHGDEVLEGIKDNMITNFSSIDKTKLLTYEAAKEAFEVDINTFKNQTNQKSTTINTNKKDELNKLVSDDERMENNKGITTVDDVYYTPPKTTDEENKQEEKNENTPKLDKLLVLTQDIEYIIQLKKLQLKQDPGEDFNATKLQSFVNQNFKKNTELQSLTELIIAQEKINQENKVRKNQEKKAQKETEAFEKEKAESLSANEETPQFVKDFFEGNKDIYDSNLDDIFKEKPENAATFTINSETKGKANDLYIRVQKYTGIEDLKEIEVGKANQFDKTKNRFNDNERVIKYKTPDKTDEDGQVIAGIDKFIVQGTQQEMQNRIADNAVENGFIPNNIDRTKTYRKNKDGSIYETEEKAKEEAVKRGITETPEKTKKASLNIFDDVGNFEAFRRFLDNEKNANVIRSDMRNIITQIMDYKPSKDTADALEEISILKNGYANVFTEYMMKQNDPSILKTYVGYITKDNLNLLGVDEKTRINNYNRLFFQDTKNGILRTEIETMLKNMDEDEKKIIIENIAQTRIAITNEKNGGTVENLKQGFDAFIDAFGPILFSVLSFLGVSKATLLTWFPNAAEKINEKFAEEYGLSPEATTALKNITNNTKFSKDEITAYGDLSKADGLKTAYTKNIQTDYIKLMESEENYQHINVNVFKKGVDIYNKKLFKNDTAKYINMNDIVNIQTKNDKEYIDSIKDPKKTIYKDIIAALIDDNSTRSRIASANANIQTPATYKDKTLTTNKQGLESKDRDRYLIRSEKDIVRYLTASLFSDKDLSYVVAENELHDGSLIPGTKNNNKQNQESSEDKEKPITEKRTEIKENLKTEVEAKAKFEEAGYTLNDTNKYQKEIAKVSNLFTGDDYKNLITETNQTSLKEIIETNTGDFKNMLTYWQLQQTANTEGYKTDKMILDPNVLANIDPTKQTFKVTEAKEGNITIEVTKKDIANDAKEGTITLTKNATTEKIETKRTEKK